MAGCAAETTSPERIVLIVADTLRRDPLSIYGGETPTPHLERLARRGWVHGNALAAFHQTSMSMAAIFSGRTPSLEVGDGARALVWNERNWCGLARFATSADAPCVPTGVPLLGEAMRDRGYRTIGVVSNPLLFRPAGYERGFDEWIEVAGDPLLREHAETRETFLSGRSGGPVNAAAFSALRARPDDRFFLYVHYMDAHDWHMRDVPYRRGVEELDRAVGDLLDFLEAEGLLDGAVVALTSDHGEALGEPHVIRGTPRHVGNPSFESVLRVPLVVAGTAPEPEGGPFRSQDLFTYLVRVAGGTPPGAGDLLPGELFVSERRYRTYRAGRFKSFVHRHDGAHTLVDLEADPGELRDASARHPEVARAHRKRIEELSAGLGAPRASTLGIERSALERLRVLGYLEEGELDAVPERRTR